MDELRKKTLFGSFWMLIERFGYLTIQFISNLVLARLLAPEDFGTIAILMVFISLANVLVDSGFSASLIQKQIITEEDKSTVFITNLFLAAIAYGMILIFAPWIAKFFHNESFTSLLRIMGVILIIDACCAIQNTLLMREMNFQLLTKIKLFAITISAATAIILAFSGLSIWALIVQYILCSTIRTIITWCVAKWKPKRVFSKESFKILFGYGSKLLLSTFIAELYVNFQQILIGRYYKPADLGYYSQARQFQQIPTGTITQVINTVSFPAYAKMQNDRGALRVLFRQNVRLVAYFNSALMLLLASIAHPLIMLLYSSKWEGSIGYFQLLCVGFGLFLAIHQCSLSLLKAVGRSDFVLRLEIMKKIIGVGLIVIGLKCWGIWGIIYALVFNSIMEIFLNGYYLKKEIDYSGFNQLIDILPSIIAASFSGVLSYLAWSRCFPQDHEFVAIVLSSSVFVFCYTLMSCICKLYGYKIVKKGIITVINKRKHING